MKKIKTKLSVETMIYSKIVPELHNHFTTTEICEELKEYDICVTKQEIENIIIKWSESGIVSDNLTEYVVNTPSW